MRIIVKFTAGDGQFRFVQGAGHVEVLTKDRLGEPAWVGTQRTPIDKATLQDKVANVLGECIVAGTPCSFRTGGATMKIDNASQITIDLGRVS